jgi:hypothetical protein
MTEESTVSPPEVTTAPRITAVTKTKNPNRVAQGKKLAAIRAEKRRMHELGARDPEPETYSDDNDDGYQKMTFYFTLVSSVAALISIPFVYRYLTGSSPAVVVETTTPTTTPTAATAERPPAPTLVSRGPGPMVAASPYTVAPDMIEFD